MSEGTIKSIDINDEMRQSYLDYAMSVIVARALPDARDGLKPVQRRILYAMHDMGLRPNTPHKKSARVVGEVLGKYHPHGDSAVYEAMVRMAQNWSLRYPMVDGQGNFGSIDGDAAAAMRYTETRMESIGHDMMIDLDKETVDFGQNFDESLQEPLVLPASIPSLLVNGSYGIAVGMSTSVPPHNLGEVVDALVYMLENWQKLDDISVPDLMQFIKGPDFPTGGMVFRYRDGQDVLSQAYGTGRGRVIMRGKAHIENIERNKSRIIITELPYQVNKTSLLKRIADLHRDGKLEGLTDLRDESDRTGMRILIETTRTVAPEDVLKKLYKLTPLESTFSIINVALVNGEPQTLPLKRALRVYIDHRLEVIRRRSEYELRKARERAHILEGLIIALDNLDTVIDTIRRSRTTETARENLMKKLKMSEIQARAVLDMPLRRLVALERNKIKDEHKEVKGLIKRLEKLLKSPKMMRDTVRDDLLKVREQYVDVRRTRVVEKESVEVVTSDDLIESSDVWVAIGENGTIGRSQTSKLLTIPGRPQAQPLMLLQASTRDLIYLLAANGEAVCRRVHDLTPAAQMGEGNHWTEGTAFASGAHLAAAVCIPEDAVGDKNGGYLFLTTLGGDVKRVRVSDLPGAVDRSFTLMRVSDDDSLGWARWTSGSDQVVLAAAGGMLIRFNESDVRPSGLPAGGVSGIKFRNDLDGLIGMEVVTEQMMNAKDKVALVWSITDNGLAKATPLDEYPLQKRYGQGVVNVKLPKDSEEVVAMVVGNRRTEIYVNSARNTTKRIRIAKAIEGIRSVRPRAVGVVTGSNRVTGAVRGRASVAEKIENMKQLTLI